MPDNSLLIDDFGSKDGKSARGSVWTCITDRVMGGVSKGSISFEEIDGKRCLRMQGDVSTKNNGGFLQAYLDLKRLNGKEYKGLRILVRGNNQKYEMHFRTPQNWFPWQYFHMEFEATDKWTSVDLPFAKFSPARMDIKKLNRVALVAIKRDFHADVSLARIELYR